MKVRKLDDEEVERGLNKMTQEMADTTTSTSGVSSVQAEEWLQRVFETARPMRRLEQISRAFTDLVGTGQDTLHIPRTQSAVSVTRTGTGEGAVRTYSELDNIETVDVTVSPSDFYKGGIAISKESQMTTMVDLVERARTEIAEQLVNDVDNDLISQVESSTPGAHNIDQTTSGELTPDSIVSAMENIEESDFEPQWLVVGTQHFADLRRDSQFTNAAEFGDNRVVMNGEIGEYLGLRVMKSTNIGDKALMVGSTRAGENVGPAMVWKERPNVGMEFDREQAEHRVFYDQAYATAAIQPNALATIQTA